jgi:hypothetical protein
MMKMYWNKKRFDERKRLLDKKEHFYRKLSMPLWPLIPFVIVVFFLIEMFKVLFLVDV